VATEAAWLGGENVSNEKNVEKSKKLLTGIGLLMEGLRVFDSDAGLTVEDLESIIRPFFGRHAFNLRGAEALAACTDHRQLEESPQFN
jgi:hypothetical protein